MDQNQGFNQPHFQDYNQDNHPKERHGCVTAWLILLIIANSASALIYLFNSEMIERASPVEIPKTILYILGFIGLLNTAFAVLLFQWKRWGFYGFTGTSIIMVALNISMGLGIAQAAVGLAGLGILFAILQIRKNDVSAWDNME